MWTGLKTKVLALLSDIKTWMREQKLKVNGSKTGHADEG